MPRCSLLVCLVACLSGCSRPTTTASGSEPSSLVRRPTSEDPVAEHASDGNERAQRPVERPVAIVTAPAVLTDLERRGASFAEVVFGQSATDTRSLHSNPLYRSLVARLDADIKAMKRADKHSGVGMRYAHRLFDTRWLRSKKTHFELVAVVNRVDRRPFDPEACGETRLIYRLAYATEVGRTPVASRLPMTINVVFWQREKDPGSSRSCREVARRWLQPDPDTAEPEWLRASTGPLAPERLGRAQLKSVEVNLQSVRWPSTVRPDLAGHAEYLLRVFHVDAEGQRFRPAPLENTPDVKRLRKNERLRADLLAWLLAHASAIDDGVVVIPDQFLATKAVSATPRGLERRANRPFSQLYSDSDFSSLELEGRVHTRSTKAFLRRLDTSSCHGCHQSRSVAGFHVVGEERDHERVVDAVALPTSPHLDGELVRRAEYLEKLAAGTPVDEARPLSEVELAAGAYGSRCGLGDPGFSHWRCNEGLVCTRLGDDELGVCLPEGEAGAGDPCELGFMKPHRNPHRDRVRDVEVRSCARLGACFTNYGGFPSGMCALHCSAAGDDEVCGLIPILRDFNLCIGRKRPFASCILNNADPAAMRACDRENPCRDDYICARTESEKGACMPPYFLFQLRVDGHVM